MIAPLSDLEWVKDRKLANREKHQSPSKAASRESRWSNQVIDRAPRGQKGIDAFELRRRSGSDKDAKAAEEPCPVIQIAKKSAA